MWLHVGRPSREPLRELPLHEELDAVGAAVEAVVGPRNSAAGRPAADQPVLVGEPQHVRLAAVKERHLPACATAEPMLEREIGVPRTFGTQVAPACGHTLLEVGELMVEADSGTKVEVPVSAQLALQPRRRDRLVHDR